MPVSMLIYGDNYAGMEACRMIISSKANIQWHKEEGTEIPYLYFEGQCFRGLKQIKEAMEQIESRIQR